MKNKFIHYCWFGGNPLPKLAKKCIESWKKYLPDFEIIEWNESNVDLNECPFIKEAYNNKKWAFVADYVRSKVMYEKGGIYFDTDMELTKNIDYLFEHESFIGVEDSGKIACGVWYEKNKKSKLSQHLLNFYQNQDSFDMDKMMDYCIPILITNFYYKYGFKEGINEVQILTNGSVIYPREYFYPLSYDHQNNIFTSNTCMIHYYDASWIPKNEKKSVNSIRNQNKLSGKIYNTTKKAAKVVLYPVVKYRHKKLDNLNYNKEIERLNKEFNKINNKEYIVFCHKDWMGIKNASTELFENVITLSEITQTYDYIINKIIELKIPKIIFSGFYDRWEYIVNKLNEKNNNIQIKVLWHGSNSMNVEQYDWEVYKIIFNLLNSNKIKSIGFVKKSMYEFYKAIGYNVEFVMNRVEINNKKDYISDSKDDDKLKIGLYASGDRWVKNFYNQLAGAALVENAIIDVIPTSDKIEEYSKHIKANIHGSKNVSHSELLYRMAQNDINIYITAVECAPIIPLESLELDVPCITGNNHHYWENTELEKYLVLNKIDDPLEIKNRIDLVIKNKEKILKLYNEWREKNNKDSKKSVDSFIK